MERKKFYFECYYEIRHKSIIQNMYKGMASASCIRKCQVLICISMYNTFFVTNIYRYNLYGLCVKNTLFIYLNLLLVTFKTFCVMYRFFFNWKMSFEIFSQDSNIMKITKIYRNWWIIIFLFTINLFCSNTTRF